MSFVSCVEGTPIGISDANTLQEDRNSAIAGRATEINSHDDIFTPSSYPFLAIFAQVSLRPTVLLNTGLLFPSEPKAPLSGSLTK